MKQVKKIEYFKKQIDSLKATVQDLKVQNSILTQENETLKKINVANQAKIESLDEVKGIYEEAIEIAHSAQAKYEEAKSEMCALKKSYQDEMNWLISRIRKQK